MGGQQLVGHPRPVATFEHDVRERATDIDGDPGVWLAVHDWLLKIEVCWWSVRRSIYHLKKPMMPDTF
jgi:hypothetical protein